MDWYLGQFNLGNNAVAQGGNPGSLNVPTTAANPLGAFPGATLPQTIADQGQSLFSSGLTSGPGTPGSTTATITGILTNPNFQVVLHALQSRSGVETLGEPEITVISGRQTQMRATSVVTVVIGLNFQQGTAATTTTGTGATP
jgi:Flp pilus assembly secretin CpaC